ncbi:MAG: carboxypeptidase-like regulatory domain-containing protein [Bacteroidales bacterium]|nr:carboxypeptidase-like regulatory domain-containing protein [Bacteroidales bacterium]
MKRILLSLLVLTGFVLFSQAIYAQTGVKGVVKDATYSETLIGATVIKEGTSHGAANNMNGRFQMEGHAGDYKQKVSYVG